jgi:uncharacterized delta-60 repeat protein
MKRKSPRSTLDPEFGNAGFAALPADMTQAVSISLLPDSRLLIAGASNEEGRFAVTRLLDNGQVDPTFGRRGVIRDQLEPYQTAVAVAAFAVEADKTLVVYTSGTADAAGIIPVVARYQHKDGLLDSGFASGGIRRLYFPDDAPTPSALAPSPSAGSSGRSALTPSGKLVTSWWYTSHGRTVTFRLDEHGQLDPSFNEVGYVVLSPLLRNGAVSATLMLASGKILVAGSFLDASRVDRPFLVRYTDDGQLDTEFGQNGIVTLDQHIGARFNQWIETPDGALAGFGKTAKDTSLVVTLHSDGRPDTSFQNNPVRDVWQWLSGTADGEKLIAVGHTANPHDTVVARYLQNGALDPDFANGNGWVRDDLSEHAEDDMPFDAKVAEGRTLIAGTRTVSGTYQAFVARRVMPEPKSNRRSGLL